MKVICSKPFGNVTGFFFVFDPVRPLFLSSPKWQAPQPLTLLTVEHYQRKTLLKVAETRDSDFSLLKEKEKSRFRYELLREPISRSVPISSCFIIVTSPPVPARRVGYDWMRTTDGSRMQLDDRTIGHVLAVHTCCRRRGTHFFSCAFVLQRTRRLPPDYCKPYDTDSTCLVCRSEWPCGER